MQRMKILMVTDNMDRGGAQTHIGTLATALRQLGHTVAVASEGGQEAQKLIRKGITHHCLPLGRKNPLSLFRSFFGLRQLIRQESFDILHAHARLPALLCHHLSRRHSVCFITTVHAHFPTRGIRHRLSRWGQGSIAVSEDLLRELYKQASLCVERCCVIPNGLDTHRFRPCQTAPNTEHHILFLSRMDQDCAESARLLCDLAPRLYERFGKVHITLAGGGNVYEEIRQRAERANLTIGHCCVEAVGNLHDPLPYLQGCSLVVGVSRCALEGMACAKPILLSGDEGFLGLLTPALLTLAAKSNFCARDCPPPTRERMWNALCAALSLTPKQSEQLGKQMRSYVLRHHNSLHLARKTISFYEKILSEKGKKQTGSVLLCGYYGYGNCGDDILLRAAVARARRTYPHLPVLALTRKPAKTRHSFDVHTLSRSNPLVLYAALRKATVLILGGGSILQDRTSLRSLLYYATLIRIVHKNGAKICLWANGLGPFVTKRGRAVASALMCRIHEIGLRDEASLRLALELGADPARCRREMDPALQGTPLLHSSKSITIPPTPFAVFALRGDASPKEMGIMHRMLTLFSQNGVTPFLAVLHPDQDRTISQRMAAELGITCQDASDAAYLMALLRNASFACGMRLHLLLLARRAGIPTLAVGSDPKLYAEYFM